MEKKIFLRQVIVSSILMLIILAAGIWFYSYYGLYQNAPISEETTSVKTGKVTDVYHGVPSGKIVVVFDNGDSLHFARHEWRLKEFYSNIGYDVDALADLLIGNTVEYQRMDRVPWIVKISIGETVIDNTKLTNEINEESLWGCAILCIIVYAMAIGCDVVYLRSKYARYKGLERKRRKKEKRREKLAQKNQE